MVGNTLNVLTEAVADALQAEKIEDGQAGITVGVLTQVLTPELVDALSRASIRDRLGVDPDFERGDRSTST